MIFIPGGFASFLTFPGVISHEWAHKKFCNWMSVKVHKVVYFRFTFWGDNTAGYVVHDEPVTFRQTFFISAGPLILNSILCLLFSYFAFQNGFHSVKGLFLFWLAFSVGSHAFPSNQDAKNILEKGKAFLKRGSFIYILTYPFYLIIWIANKLRFFWFDFIYSVFLIGIVGGWW